MLLQYRDIAVAVQPVWVGPLLTGLFTAILLTLQLMLLVVLFRRRTSGQPELRPAAAPEPAPAPEPSALPDPVAAAPKSGRRDPPAEQLCSLVHETTRLDPRRKPGPQLASLIKTIFHLDSVAIFDADLQEVYTSGVWADDMKDVLQNICIFETVNDEPETGLSRRVVRMGNLPIGSLVLRGETRGQMASTIAAIVAITFDRYHALANESRTESARQTEQLRTTVLDSLAHAYKTPLTVISAASEGLSAIGDLSSAQAGLVALIDEQTALLNSLTTRLLKTSRLQASDMTPHIEKVAVASMIEDVVASLRDQLAAVTVKISLPKDDLAICCDRSLVVALLTQYVDNAAKYGDPGSTVTIAAAEHATEVIFSVHSVGPVIPVSDFERIFDRYYRSSATTNKAPGTGIGLSVAKRTAQAQGGHVWVTSDVQRGTTFYASLPTAPPPTTQQPRRISS
jgi:two-component system sensor histidine kinase KdpD